MKKLLNLFLVLIIVSMVSIPVHAIASGNDGLIQVLVNGDRVEFDTEPVIIDNVVYIPIRAIIEKLNGDIYWNGEKQEVTITVNGRTVHLYVGNKNISMNDHGKKISFGMNYPTFIKNDRMYVPKSFFNHGVLLVDSWDKMTNTLSLDSLDTKEQPENLVDRIRSRFSKLTYINITGDRFMFAIADDYHDFMTLYNYMADVQVSSVMTFFRSDVDIEAIYLVDSTILEELDVPITDQFLTDLTKAIETGEKTEVSYGNYIVTLSFDSKGDPFLEMNVKKMDR